MLLGFPAFEVDMESPDIELGPGELIGVEEMRGLDEPNMDANAVENLICAARSALIWIEFARNGKGFLISIQLREAISKAGGYVPPPLSGNPR